MKIDWTYSAVFLPIAFWLALFSCTNPPKPDPLALRVIQIDHTELVDLGPLTWPEGVETE